MNFFAFVKPEFVDKLFFQLLDDNVVVTDDVLLYGTIANVDAFKATFYVLRSMGLNVEVLDENSYSVECAVPDTCLFVNFLAASFGVDIYALYDHITEYRERVFEEAVEVEVEGSDEDTKESSRRWISLGDCGIPVGEKITYVKEPHFVVEVVDSRKVCDEYGREGCITPILKTLSEEAGIKYVKHDSFLYLWTYRGVLLADIYAAGGVDLYPFDDEEDAVFEDESVLSEEDNVDVLEDSADDEVVIETSDEAVDEYVSETEVVSDIEQEAESVSKDNDTSAFVDTVTDIFSLF